MKNSNNAAYACYWKNGAKFNLTNAGAGVGTDAGALDIAISGSDVYLVGFEKQLTGNYRALYWKNGVANYLTDGTYSVTASSIYVQ